MKLVKKIVGVALIFVLMVSMVGCNTTTNTKENKKNTKLTIMTTLFPYYDFARAVIGDVKDIDLELLVSPGRTTILLNLRQKMLWQLIRRIRLFITVAQ